MAFKLPGKFATLTIADMGVQNGTPTAPGAGVVLTALVKSAEVTIDMGTVDMTAIADALEYVQCTHESDGATIETFVPGTGVQLRGLIGHYVRLSWKEAPTLPLNTLDAVVTGHKWSLSDAQSESITIKGGAN